MGTILLFGFIVALYCCGPKSDSKALTSDMPLHLEDHISQATIVGSLASEDAQTSVEWHFNKPQPDWKPIVPLRPGIKPIEPTRVEDALRLHLTEATKFRDRLGGGIYVDLADWDREDWAYIIVQARTNDDIEAISVNFNTIHFHTLYGRA